MRRTLVGLTAMICWFGASAAAAQDLCHDVRSLIAEARTEFVNLTGEPLSDSHSQELAIFLGAHPLTGAGTCAVAQQTVNGRRFATSYTCSGAGPDSREGVEALAAQVAHCLDLDAWAEQQQANGRGPWLSQYGLIRLTITRNGAAGLALGVEVFRDERGDAMGSTTRGDAVDPDGVRRCMSKTPEEIARLFAMYGERPGAERFEEQQFVGFRNRLSQSVVAFVTRPSHPAHPAIIVRSVFERDGSVVVTAGGDFAGDCQAFHELLQQVQEMNQNLRR